MLIYISTPFNDELFEILEKKEKMVEMKAKEKL